jgi:phage shock protein A
MANGKSQMAKTQNPEAALKALSRTMRKMSRGQKKIRKALARITTHQEDFSEALAALERRLKRL